MADELKGAVLSAPGDTTAHITLFGIAQSVGMAILSVHQASEAALKITSMNLLSNVSEEG